MFIKNWKLVSISNVIDSETADDESILIYLIEITLVNSQSPSEWLMKETFWHARDKLSKIFHISLMKKNRQLKKFNFSNFRCHNLTVMFGVVVYVIGAKIWKKKEPFCF